MAENDTANVWNDVSWEEGLEVMHDFLDPSRVSPFPKITDRQLVDLMTACGNARARLADTTGARASASKLSGIMRDA